MLVILAFTSHSQSFKHSFHFTLKKFGGLIHVIFSPEFSFTFLSKEPLPLTWINEIDF